MTKKSKMSLFVFKTQRLLCMNHDTANCRAILPRLVAPTETGFYLIVMSHPGSLLIKQFGLDVTKTKKCLTISLTFKNKYKHAYSVSFKLLSLMFTPPDFCLY